MSISLSWFLLSIVVSCFCYVLICLSLSCFTLPVTVSWFATVYRYVLFWFVCRYVMFWFVLRFVMFCIAYHCVMFLVLSIVMFWVAIAFSCYIFLSTVLSYVLVLYVAILSVKVLSIVLSFNYAYRCHVFELSIDVSQFWIVYRMCIIFGLSIECELYLDCLSNVYYLWIVYQCVIFLVVYRCVMFLIVCRCVKLLYCLQISVRWWYNSFFERIYLFVGKYQEVRTDSFS